MLQLTKSFMKSTILWDKMPCSPLSVNLRFGGTYCDVHAAGLTGQQRKNAFLGND
jgi:hypothetical protein